MTGSVLLSSAGRRVALLDSFRASARALGLDGRVIAADCSPVASAFQLADDRRVVPRCDDPDFVPTMVELCRREEVVVLVPTIDPELPVLAAAADEFAAVGTTVAVSTPATVAIGADKRATHAWLTANGFPTVAQATVAEVLSAGDGWELPVIVKPARGSASIGVERISDVRRLETMAHDEELVVQSIARGVEHTVDLYVDRGGRVRCAVPRRRIEVRGGEVSKAVTVRCPELVDLASDLARALPGAFGALNVQVFVDPETNAFAVIEINPRFGGGFPLSYAAGADFPRWILEEALGRPSSATADGWQVGLVMLRYDDAVFVDASDAGIVL